MMAAIALPRILHVAPERPLMLGGAGLMAATLLGLSTLISVWGLSWPTLLIAWGMIGLGYSTVLTPSGRLLARSAHAEDRPASFAAQFALSHACWLLTYPLSGWLLTKFGTVPALLTLAALALTGIMAALRFWPADDPVEVAHTHDNLPLDHPHLKGHRRHTHALVIDEAHPQWDSHF